MSTRSYQHKTSLRASSNGHARLTGSGIVAEAEAKIHELQVMREAAAAAAKAEEEDQELKWRSAAEAVSAEPAPAAVVAESPAAVVAESPAAEAKAEK